MSKNIEETNEKKVKKSYGVLKIIIAIILTAIITYFCTINFTLNSYLNGADITYLTTKLVLIKNKLEDTYIYDMDSEKMIESSIKGYVNGLGDKYTEYLTKEDMKELLETTSGSFVGIGVYMVNNTADNTIVIVGVIDGSVAQSAGLQVGDIISKVNDIEYKGEQLDEVSESIKGEEGSEVKITVIRNSETLDFNIKRSSVKIKSVNSKMLDDNIGYIQIASFNDGTADEFKSAYNEIKDSVKKGLVIDLRNNGGGVVDESLKIAETMVEKGKTLLITADKNKNEKVDKSKENPIINVPVILLINNYTASASEILAGTLKENCGYKIVGIQSYGKGVIQSIYSFKDGTGLKVTMEEYFTPNHNVINKVGISPDIEVDLDDEWKNISNVPYENDLQLQRAVEELNK